MLRIRPLAASAGMALILGLGLVVPSARGQERAAIRLSQVRLALPPSDKALALRQALVKGLLVQETTPGEYVGSASQMNATAVPLGIEQESSNIGFNQMVGEDMATALREVVKFHSVRHGGFPRGHAVEIAWQEKYSPKDGPSGAVACALLLESLLTGVTMAEDFAVTGDLNADGKVEPVGGVPAKVRGAKEKGCHVVAVPAVCDRQIADVVLLDGPAMLWSTQVFGISTFDEALAVGRSQRDEKLARALAEFGEVQRVLAQRGAGLLTNPKVQEKLRIVVEAAPNHLSARQLLLVASGKSPTQLSPAGSINLVEALGQRILLLTENQSTTGAGLAPDELTRSLNELGRMRPKLDKRTWAYADSVLTLCTVIRDLNKDTARTEAKRTDQQKRLNEALAATRQSWAKLKADKDFMAECMK